jgi:hypothetical protein
MMSAAAPKIAKLPRPILKKLVNRFETAHLKGYTFDHHFEWLKLKGYPISRSLIHRFCQQLRELKALNPDSEDILALYLNEIERSKICL